MIPSLRGHERSKVFDDWSGAPSGGPWAKWFGGVMLPLPLIVYGVACFVTRHGVLPDDEATLALTGAEAVAVGVASLAAGLFLHVHYFWGNVWPASRLPEFGKVAALVGFLCGAGYAIVRIAVDF